MSYKLNVSFRGLNVFVPGTDLSKPQDWFGVFLVNANSDQLGRLNNDPRFNLHFPGVRFDLKDLKNAPRGIDGKGLWELHQEDVVIRPRWSPGGPLTVDYDPMVSNPSNPSEEQLFNWVPSLSDLIGSGKLKDDCLQQSPQKNLMAARIHLTQGRLFTRDLANFANKLLTVRFVPKKSNLVEGVTAVVVGLEMSGLSGDLTLRARPFDPKLPRLRKLVLNPGRRRELSIEFLNLCPEELMLPPQRFPGVDEDFKWNYLLSDTLSYKQGPDQPLPRPLVIQFDPGADGGGEFGRCTSPRAAPLIPAQSKAMLAIAKKT